MNPLLRLVAAMSAGFLLFAAAAAAAAPAPARSADDRRAVALYPLRPLGIEPEIAERLDEQLRGELAALPGLRVLPKEASAAKLAAAGEGCDGDPACTAGISKSLGARDAVTGVAAALGASYVVTLKLVEVATAVETARVSERFQGTGDELLAASRAAAYRLLAPERYVGEVELRVPLEGTHVLVDGRDVGRTPLAGPIAGLAPGPHQLRLHREGFDDFERSIEVKFQRRTVVRVDLAVGALTSELAAIGAASAPDAAVGGGPSHGHPLALAAGAVSAAALVAGAVVATVALAGRASASSACDEPGACSREQATKLAGDADSLATASYVLFGIAGAAGAGAFGLYLWEEPSPPFAGDGAGGGAGGAAIPAGAGRGIAAAVRF